MLLARPFKKHHPWGSNPRPFRAASGGALRAPLRIFSSTCQHHAAGAMPDLRGGHHAGERREILRWCDAAARSYRRRACSGKEIGGVVRCVYTSYVPCVTALICVVNTDEIELYLEAQAAPNLEKVLISRITGSENTLSDL